MKTYPRVLQHAGSQDQVVHGAEHHHDAYQNKDDIPHDNTRVDPPAGFVEQFDDLVLWLLDLLQIKLRVDDLVPDDGYPGGGDEPQQDGVDDHVLDPEGHVGPDVITLHSPFYPPTHLVL